MGAIAATIIGGAPVAAAGGIAYGVALGISGFEGVEGVGNMIGGAQDLPTVNVGEDAAFSMAGFIGADAYSAWEY